MKNAADKYQIVITSLETGKKIMDSTVENFKLNVEHNYYRFGSSHEIMSQLGILTGSDLTITGWIPAPPPKPERKSVTKRINKWK